MANSTFFEDDDNDNREGKIKTLRKQLHDAIIARVVQGLDGVNPDEVSEEQVRVRLERAKKDVIGEIVRAVKERAPKVNVQDFDNDPDMVHFNNGWYNKKTKLLSPHSPDRLSLAKSSMDFHREMTEDEILRAEEDYRAKVKAALRDHYSRNGSKDNHHHDDHEYF
jgi:phage/plasmid-associated DNA primase